MSVFNSLQGLARRYNQAVTTLANQQEQEGLTSVAPELVFSVVLELASPEFRRLLRLRAFSINGNAAAGGAGVRSQFGAFNPPTVSGMTDVIVTIVWGYSKNDTAAAQNNVLRVTGTSYGATVGGAIVLDARDGDFDSAAGQNAAVQARSKTTLALSPGNAIIGQRVPPNDTGDPMQIGVVLKPGTGIYWEPGADNLAIAGFLFGYERPITPGELDV